MTGPVIFLACALFLWAAICLDDWLRERRQYEAQVEMWRDLLAQRRNEMDAKAQYVRSLARQFDLDWDKPSTKDLEREWTRFLDDLPETRP